jgi:hypothetical protein
MRRETGKEEGRKRLRIGKDLGRRFLACTARRRGVDRRARGQLENSPGGEIRKRGKREEGIPNRS